MAAEVRARTQRYRAGLARPQSPSLAHQTFTDAAALDHAIHDAVTDLNRERIPDSLAMPRISA